MKQMKSLAEKETQQERRRPMKSQKTRWAVLMVVLLGLVGWNVTSAGLASSGVAAGQLTEITRIPVGKLPGFMAISQDGSRLYQVNQFGGSDPGGDSNTGSVSVIDTATNAVIATIPFGAGFPFQIAITPDGSRGYVAVSKASGRGFSTGFNRIEVIDLATNEIASTINVIPQGSAGGPIGVAIAPDGTRAYVTHRGDSRVIVIDTDPASAGFHTIVTSIFTGGLPVGIDITPDGSRAYVAQRATATVSVIDTNPASATFHTVLTTVPTGLAPSTSGTSVAVTPDGTRAYVTYPTDNRVAVIDTDPGSGTFHTVLATIPAGTAPLRLVTVIPDGTCALITTAGSPGSMLILDTDPSSPTFHTVIDAVPVGTFPTGVVFQNLFAFTGTFAYAPHPHRSNSRLRERSSTLERL